MDAFDRENTIWRLLGEKYPAQTVGTRTGVETKQPLLLTQNPETAIQEEAAVRYFEELNALSDDELSERQAKADREKVEENERQFSFNKPHAMADEKIYSYWCKAAAWYDDEFTALLLARNPKVVTMESIKRAKNLSTFANEFLDLRELVSRAVLKKQLLRATRPGFAIAWAKRNRIPVPKALEAAVREHGHQVADWKTAYDQQAAIVADLKAKIAKLEVAETKPEPTTADLGIRERDSLLKIVLGMAIKGYSYDPKASRNPTAKEVASDLSLIGLRLDEDTVRKYLAEATELLPGDETEQDR